MHRLDTFFFAAEPAAVLGQSLDLCDFDIDVSKIQEEAIYISLINNCDR
jgi:hypothetical protein